MVTENINFNKTRKIVIIITESKQISSIQCLSSIINKDFSIIWSFPKAYQTTVPQTDHIKVSYANDPITTNFPHF